MQDLELKLQDAAEKMANGRYAEAIKIYEALADNRKMTPDQHFQRQFNIGICQAHLKQYDEAEHAFDLALKRAVMREQRADQTAVLHRQGLLAKERGQYEQALSYFRQELSKWCSLMPNYYGGLARNFFEQGQVMLEKGELVDARMYFNHAFTFAETEGGHLIEGKALQAMGQLYLKMNKKKDALKLFRRSHESYKKADDSDGIKEVTELIAQCDPKQKSAEKKTVTQK